MTENGTHYRITYNGKTIRQRTVYRYTHAVGRILDNGDLHLVHLHTTRAYAERKLRSRWVREWQQRHNVKFEIIEVTPIEIQKRTKEVL